MLYCNKAQLLVQHKQKIICNTNQTKQPLAFAKQNTQLTDMMNQHLSLTCCLFPILILLYPTKQNIPLLITTFFHN